MRGLVASAWLLLWLETVFPVGKCDTPKVLGYTGQNVTLPCKYNFKYHGATPVCWGKGVLPYRGCTDQMIDTDGVQVVNRKSNRFQLLGPLDAGDVSLTILNVTERDSGQYGCRIHVPGAFNDEKYHVQLTIETTPEPTPSRTTDHVTATEQMWTNNTQGHMSATEDWETSGPTTRQIKLESGESVLALVLVCCVLFIVTVAVVGTAIYATRRLGKLKTHPMSQWLATSIRYRSSTSGAGLQNRASAVENIYQLEEINDYEDTP